MSIPIEAKFGYHRIGRSLHIVAKGISNHEMRAILVGFWLTLDEDDRIDYIAELQHYLESGSTPPEVSKQIAQVVNSARHSKDN